MNRNASKILITEGEIKKRVKALGEMISRDYRGKTPVLICVLKGGFVFLADLMRAITVDHEVDFMAVSSYRGSTNSSGDVRIIMDLNTNIFDRDVLIVEDIIDTGHTLSKLIKHLRLREPRSIKICSLLDKRGRREVDIPVDYVGFDIPNEFVIGYGLDYMELYRNLPYIGVLGEGEV
ncbi:MAG: hypoxanthine phosphoribosyltransferase [bacterium]